MGFKAGSCHSEYKSHPQGLLCINIIMRLVIIQLNTSISDRKEYHDIVVDSRSIEKNCISTAQRMEFTRENVSRGYPYVRADSRDH